MSRSGLTYFTSYIRSWHYRAAPRYAAYCVAGHQIECESLGSEYGWSLITPSYTLSVTTHVNGRWTYIYRGFTSSELQVDSINDLYLVSLDETSLTGYDGYIAMNYCDMMDHIHSWFRDRVV